MVLPKFSQEPSAILPGICKKQYFWLKISRQDVRGEVRNRL